jgi:hypothetical protein
MVTIRDAEEPFSGAVFRRAPPADMVIRSMDFVDFHCHQDRLRGASQIFAARIESTELFKGKYPVVQLLKETSEVIRCLLLHVYPAPVIPGHLFADTDPAHIYAVYEAAQRYLFAKERQILENTLLCMSPLWMYVRGILLDDRQLAARAAYDALDHGVPATLPPVPELEFIHPKALSFFADIHNSCGRVSERFATLTGGSLHYEMLAQPDIYPDFLSHEVATNGRILGEFVWWDFAGHSAGCGPTWETPPIGEPVLEAFPAQWFQDHTTRLAQELRNRPGRRTVARESLAIAPPERAAILRCGKCTQLAKTHLENYGSQLTSLTHDLNSEVRFEHRKLLSCVLSLNTAVH